jgi:hypothetical protein
MTNIDVIQRKPGRPRAITEDRIEEVISLHESGLGYRAITHALERKGVFVAKREEPPQQPVFGFYHYFATG